MTDGGFVIDMTDPDARRYIFLTTAQGRLKIEMAGMRFKGVPTLTSINKAEGTSFRNRKAALRYCEVEAAKLLAKRQREEEAGQ